MSGHEHRVWGRVRPIWALMAAALLLAACGPSAPAPAATTAPKAAPTQAPAAKPAEAAKPAPADPAKPAAKDAPAAADLQGKNVRIIVGYPPGGGFDSNARLLAPYLQEALPGNPTVVVENLPGADSLVAAKTVLTGPVRPDEVNIVVYISTLLVKSQLSGGLEGFAPEKESAYVGKPDSGPTQLTLCANKNAVKNLDEFLNLRQPIKVAGTTGASYYDTLLRWTKEVGYPIDLIFGYAGTAQMILAFNQNEVDAMPACRDVDLAQNPDWLEKDLIVPLIYWGEPAEALKKAQAQGRYPWLKSAAEARTVTAEQKSVLQNWLEINAGSNVYAMHKQTPAPTLAAVRQAFKQAVTSPAFVADIERRQLQAGYLSPEDIEKNIRDVETSSQGAKDLIKRMLAL